MNIHTTDLFKTIIIYYNKSHSAIIKIVIWVIDTLAILMYN